MVNIERANLRVIFIQVAGYDVDFFRNHHKVRPEFI